jgi:hypothetical protein
MNPAVMALANRSFDFHLYDFHLEGVSLKELAVNHSLPVHSVEERIEAVRLCLKFQVKLALSSKPQLQQLAAAWGWMTKLSLRPASLFVGRLKSSPSVLFSSSATLPQAISWARLHIAQVPSASLRFPAKTFTHTKASRIMIPPLRLYKKPWTSSINFGITEGKLLTTPIAIADTLVTAYSAAQLLNDLVADSSRFKYEIRLSAKHSESCECIDTALRLASEWYDAALTQIVVQESDQEGADSFWIYPNQAALECSEFLDGEAWVDDEGNQRSAVSLICSPVEDEDSAKCSAVSAIMPISRPTNSRTLTAGV